jgi:hypothetical protein
LAKRYTKELLNKNPIYAIKILSIYVWFIAGTEKPAKFNFDDFSSNYDPKEIKSYLEKVDLENLSLSVKEIYALEEFNGIFELRFKAKPNE